MKRPLANDGGFSAKKKVDASKEAIKRYERFTFRCFCCVSKLFMLSPL